MKLIKKNIKGQHSDPYVIENQDCFVTMDSMKKRGQKVDIIITSPPYNTTKNTYSELSRKNHESRYDIYMDNMTHEQYNNWTKQLFTAFNEVLCENGVILYNLNYGTDNTNRTSSCMDLFDTLYNSLKDTPFTVADIIIWKKNSAIPNNTSPNKCTRIWEFVFVIARKTELMTFNSGKTVSTVNERTGQKYYNSVFNFIEAPNNDGSNRLNKATFSSSLVKQLLGMYAPCTDITVYDPFIGTGTTAVACKQFGCRCIGSELSKAQCEYAAERLKGFDSISDM